MSILVMGCRRKERTRTDKCSGCRKKFDVLHILSLSFCVTRNISTLHIKMTVIKKLNIEMIILNFSSLVAGHQFWFCIFLLIGVNSDLVGLVDS